MPGTQMKSSHPETGDVEIPALQFDQQNPRFAGRRFSGDEDVVRELYENDDVNELIQSILSTGYVDFEPFIVLKEGTIVLEGNRRLAALKLISDEGLRKRLRISLPDIDDAKPLPVTIRAIFVESREAARSFIGFKHINGPAKWDAIAKAKYAAEWLQSGGDINAIARTLGDNFNTVRRLVDGWFAYQQALEEGFAPDQITNKRFAFSHLYTALTKPSVRAHLGLPIDRSSQQPSLRPIPPAKHDEFMQLMSWLYGQEHRSEPTLIRNQNPDLNRLSAVLGAPEAKAMLIASRDLDKSYERVVPGSSRFEDALMKAADKSEEALGLAGFYAGEAALLKVAEGMQRTSRSLVTVMRDRADKSAE